MSFSKDYPNRKDHRKPYRGSKAFDSHCRNHGACGWCATGRQHKRKRQEPLPYADHELTEDNEDVGDYPPQGE